MQEPLVPAEVDLHSFAYMPLDVRRLRDSDLAARESPEACWAAVLLWAASWHQVPAASLPDDDMVLANLAGYGRVVKEWRKVKQGALRGWVKCSDGRLYHPVVAEKALEAWESKFKHGYAKLCERLRKENHKRKAAKEIEVGIPTYEQWKSGAYPDGIPPEAKVSAAGNPSEASELSAGIPPEKINDPPERTLTSAGTKDDSTGIPPENALNREVTEQNREVTERNGEVRDLKPNNLNPVTAGVEKPTPPPPKAINGHAAKPKSEPKTEAVWQAYSAAYFARYGTEPVRNAKGNAAMAALVDRLGNDEAPHVAAFFVRHNKAFYVSSNHPLGVLLQDCEGLRTQWATGQQTTATGAMLQDRTQTNYNAFAPLIAAAKEREAREKNGK